MRFLLIRRRGECMEISYSGFNARDLRGGTIAEVLVNVEADLSLVDSSAMIYSERAFPVAELARSLSRWIASGEGGAANFSFSSMSFEDAGSINMTKEPTGWSVWSGFTPEIRSASMSWVDLEAAIRDFIARVAQDLEILGIDARAVL